MKSSLWLKLTGSFALVVLAIAASMIVSIRLITENRYARLVRDTDRARAEALAPQFAQWYERQGGWNGVQDLVDSLAPAGAGMMSAWRGGWRMDGGPMMGTRRGSDGPARQRITREMERGRMLMGPRLVLTDTSGEVWADSSGTLLHKRLPARGSPPVGVEVVSGGRTVGRLLVGSMIAPTLSAFEREFLGSVNTAVIAISLGAVLLALLAGSLLFRHIVSPLRRLSQASERIASGDLEVRVPAGSADELGTLAGRFNAMAAALQDSRRRYRQMVADAAHELRTPVSLLQGTLEMMVEGIYPADRDRLEQLHTESRRLGQLVADMQDLSRADAGSMPMSLARVDVAGMLEAAVGPFRTAAQGKAVHLQTDCATSLGEITADRDRLVRVLANLLANALRHTPEGGRIEVAAAAVEDGQEVQFCVQDSGPGIPVHEAERVFDRFYRTDASRSRDSGGSGLGLAISREIVNAHGGRIWVDLSCPAGARVCFRIPRHPARS